MDQNPGNCQKNTSTMRHSALCQDRIPCAESHGHKTHIMRIALKIQDWIVLERDNYQTMSQNRPLSRKSLFVNFSVRKDTAICNLLHQGSGAIYFLPLFAIPASFVILRPWRLRRTSMLVSASALLQLIYRSMHVVSALRKALMQCLQVQHT